MAGAFRRGRGPCLSPASAGTLWLVSRSSYDRTGQIRPFKQRNPVAYWTAFVIVAAMLATGFVGLASVL